MGFCAVLEQFSGFEFILLPTIVYARHLSLAHTDETDNWKRTPIGPEPQTVRFEVQVLGEELGKGQARA
jgi:hypothetical protein